MRETFLRLQDDPFSRVWIYEISQLSFMAHWKRKETRFCEYGFELTLPGNWQSRPGGVDRWVYRSSDRKEQVTITRTEAVGEGDDEGVMRRAVGRSRRALELGLGREPDFELSEPEIGERAGVKAAWFCGNANQGLHQFQEVLFFTPNASWAVFYEAFKISEEEARRRFGQVVDSVTIQGH